MPVFVDLINQVQKILPVRFGGTGNDFGGATEMLMAPYMNDTGAAIPLGTVVKLLAIYGDRRVIATDSVREPALGVVVGRYSSVAATLHQFERTAPDDKETVAVCLAGRCRVLVTGTIAGGEFAYTYGDGTTYSQTVIDIAAIGQFESENLSGGMAELHLWGTPSTPGMRGNIVAVFGDGVTALQVNTKGDYRLPFNLTIVKATLLAIDSGACVIDIFVDTYANFPATGADSITNATPPEIVSGIKSEDSTLAGWIVDLDADSTMRFSVASASGISQVSLILDYIRR